MELLEESVLSQKQELESLSNVTEFIKMKTNFYEKQVVRMTVLTSTLLNLRLTSFAGSMRALEKLVQLMEQFNVDELTSGTLALVHANALRKRKIDLAAMKIYRKRLLNLNRALVEDFETVNLEVEEAEGKVENVVSVSPDEVKTMEQKIHRYGNELVKLERKFPWLKNAEFNLRSISKQAKVLAATRSIKQDLLNEMKRFHGVSPNIQEATDQLNQLKSKLDEINQKLNSIN